MGLQTASGHLEKAARQLTGAWNQAKESWKDAKMSAFEDRYITTFQQDTRLAVDTMARMGALLEKVRQECSGGETY